MNFVGLQLNNSSLHFNFVIPRRNDEESNKSRPIVTDKQLKVDSSGRLSSPRNDKINLFYGHLREKTLNAYPDYDGFLWMFRRSQMPAKSCFLSPKC